MVKRGNLSRGVPRRVNNFERIDTSYEILLNEFEDGQDLREKCLSARDGIYENSRSAPSSPTLPSRGFLPSTPLISPSIHFPRAELAVPLYAQSTSARDALFAIH